MGPGDSIRSSSSLGQQSPQPLGPFDQRNGAAECVLDAEFDCVLGGFQPEQVEVPDRGIRLADGLVDLDKRERRARHLFVGARPRSDEGASENRLAGAEIAAKGEDVAAPGDGRQPDRERFCRGLVRQRQLDAQRRGIGFLRRGVSGRSRSRIHA